MKAFTEALYGRISNFKIADNKMDQSPTDIFHFDDMRFYSTYTSRWEKGGLFYMAIEGLKCYSIKSAKWNDTIIIL